MKKSILLFLFLIPCVSFSVAQDEKKTEGCKMYLDGAVVDDISVELALKWSDLVPPTVQCSDGKVYLLESFQISFFTLKPLMNRDFGLGERGVPIMARNAIAKGQPGDTVILKDAKYIDENGESQSLPVISFKLQ